MKTSSSWYKRCFLGCIKTEKINESTEPITPSIQIQDFLSSNSNRHDISVGDQAQPKPPVQQRMPQAPHFREYLDQLPFEARPTTSFSKWFDKSQAAGNQIDVSSSNLSLSSTLSGSVPVNEWDKPLLHGTSTGMGSNMSHERQSHHIRGIEGPDDFHQFTSDLRGRTELDSHPISLATSTASQAQGRSQPQRSVESAEVAPELVVCPAIDSTPIPVTPSSVGRAPGSEAAGQFQPYPGEIKVSYILPQLQAGWAGGVPPMLWAGHAGRSAPRMRYLTANMPQAETQRAESSTNPEAPRYSWPLVDFDHELFLNSNPAEAGLAVPRRRHPKHQEPRIPSMEFLEAGLEQEVTAMLGNLKEEEAQRRQAQDHERRLRRPATVYSPVSPEGADGIGNQIHEMEASNIPIPQAYRRTPSRQQVHSARMSPVSPIQSPNGGGERVVSYHEYNWPRFSDVHEYQDPADEYSRRYRDRRREMRRGNQQTHLQTRTQTQ